MTSISNRVAGSKAEIERFKTEIQARFKISDLGTLKKHLGVWYDRKKDEIGEYYELEMSKYRDDIIKDFEGITGKRVKPAPTPGYPGTSLVKNADEETKKEEFRKLLGKLMWYCKKLLPECSNATRELASYMDNPGPEHWKAMTRLVSYIAGNDSKLKLRRPQDLRVRGFVDSNYATNKETRRSVTGYVLTLGGCLVTWQSKSQPSVTLSSTEAEYVALSTCATEVKFIQMLFEQLVPNENVRPATIYEDNTGAIYLVENQAVGNRTKHISVRWHHIREMTSDPDPRLKVVFVRTDENPADILTKNVTEALHVKHTERITQGGLTAVYETADREDVKKVSVVIDKTEEEWVNREDKDDWETRIADYECLTVSIDGQSNNGQSVEERTTDGQTGSGLTEIGQTERDQTKERERDWNYVIMKGTNTID